jgi:hypothetical protein
MPLHTSGHAVGALTSAFVATFVAAGAASAAGTPPSVIAMSQKAKGDTVSITYAYMPKDGVLAIYSLNSSGKPGATPIGKVELKAGDHRDIKVKLDTAPKPGMQLEAILESSGGKPRPFEDSGAPALETFKVL